MTPNQVNEWQRRATAAMQSEQAKIQQDLAAFEHEHGMNNDRAAISEAAPHVKADFWSVNSHARTLPGDVLIVYRATQNGRVFACIYTYTEAQPNSRAYIWKRQMFPDTLEAAETRSWRAMRWPDQLTSKHLATLARGWTLPGGFAISPSIAKNHARMAAARRHQDLVDQLLKIEAFIQEDL